MSIISCIIYQWSHSLYSLGYSRLFAHNIILLLLNPYSFPRASRKTTFFYWSTFLVKYLLNLWANGRYSSTHVLFVLLFNKYSLSTPYSPNRLTHFHPWKQSSDLQSCWESSIQGNFSNHSLASETCPGDQHIESNEKQVHNIEHSPRIWTRWGGLHKMGD